MRISLLPKLALPVAFFGYSALANLSLLFDPGQQMTLGEATLPQSIDRLYREELPHKHTAIGFIGATRYLLLGEGRLGVLVGDQGTLFSAEEYRPPEKALDIYKAALEEIQATKTLIEADGAKLIIMPLPAKNDVLEALAPDSDMAHRQAGLYAQFVADLHMLGVDVLDSRSVMLAADSPFLSTDTHWSAQGVQAVTDLVASSALLPHGDQSFEVASKEEKTLTGDLVSYVTSDALAPLVGLQPEKIAIITVEPVASTAKSEAPILDLFGGGDEDSIDLVGTSYSANPDWSFAEKLKLALSRDVINYAQEGRGPIAPMLDYLHRRADEAGAGTVLWEFPVRYLTDPDLISKEGQI